MKRHEDLIGMRELAVGRLYIKLSELDAMTEMLDVAMNENEAISRRHDFTETYEYIQSEIRKVQEELDKAVRQVRSNPDYRRHPLFQKVEKVLQAKRSAD